MVTKVALNSKKDKFPAALSTARDLFHFKSLDIPSFAKIPRFVWNDNTASEFEKQYFVFTLRIGYLSNRRIPKKNAA